MGAIKPALVLHYMQHYSLSSVSLSDTDTVWLRDPKGATSVFRAIPPNATAAGVIYHMSFGMPDSTPG